MNFDPPSTSRAASPTKRMRSVSPPLETIAPPTEADSRPPSPTKKLCCEDDDDERVAGTWSLSSGVPQLGQSPPTSQSSPPAEIAGPLLSPLHSPQSPSLPWSAASPLPAAVCPSTTGPLNTPPPTPFAPPSPVAVNATWATVPATLDALESHDPEFLARLEASQKRRERFINQMRATNRTPPPAIRYDQFPLPEYLFVAGTSAEPGHIARMLGLTPDTIPERIPATAIGWGSVRCGVYTGLVRKGWKDEKGWLGPGSLARLQEHGEMEEIEQIKGYVLKVTAKQLFDGMPPSCCNIAYFKVVLDGDERMRKVKVFGWELVVKSAQVMNSCGI